MSRTDFIGFRLANEFSKEELVFKAEQYGLSTSQLMRKGLEMMMGLTPECFTKLETYAKALGFSTGNLTEHILNSRFDAIRSVQPPETVANRIALFRERLGLSQTELARRVRIAAPNLSAIEHGHRVAWPKAKRRLARALNCRESDLFPPKVQMIHTGNRKQSSQERSSLATIAGNTKGEPG